VAGPSRSSIRSASPARFQYSRATDVHSSLTSQHSSRPPSVRPRATQIAEYPVKVPTSTALAAPTSLASSVMNVPWSGPICMPASEPNIRSVCSASSVSISSGGVLCASTYSCSASLSCSLLLLTHRP